MDNIPDIPPYYSCDSLRNCLADEGIPWQDGTIIFSWKKYKLSFKNENELTLKNWTNKLTIDIKSRISDITDNNSVNLTLKWVISKVRMAFLSNEKSAKNILKEIRSRYAESNIEYLVHILDLRLEKCNKSYKDIWTSKSEIESMRKIWAQKDAIVLIGNIKDTYLKWNIDHIHMKFRYYVSLSWKSLDFYWTSENELNELDAKWHEISAKEAYLRIKDEAIETKWFYKKIFAFNAKESWKWEQYFEQDIIIANSK